MTAVDWIILIPLMILTLAVFYLWIILPAGLLFRKGYPKEADKYDFLILVPAHNETEGITRTIDSLKQMTPTGEVNITVIADNCTDETAGKAREAGANVIERNNPDLRGKGYALEYALEQSDLSRFDAVVIVDADTIVAPNLLEAMTRPLVNGVGAVQVSNEFLLDRKTPLEYLQQMANHAENVFYYNARTVLGFPVLLRGTGMAISREVLEKHPWDSHSVTEDVDYAVNIVLDGYQVDFSLETWVRSAATSTYEQSFSQKSRWAGGTFGLIFGKGPRVLLNGITQFRLGLIDLAWSFLTLSRPTLIFICLFPLILSLIASPGNKLLFALWSVILIALLILYLIMGILFVEDKKAAVKALLHAPFYGMWLFMVQLKALFQKDRDWIRTERKG